METKLHDSLIIFLPKIEDNPGNSVQMANSLRIKSDKKNNLII